MLATAALIWTGTFAVNKWLFGGDLSIGIRLFNAFVVGSLAVALVVAARHEIDRRPFAGLRLPLSRAAWLPFLVGLGAFLVPSMIGLAVGTAAGWVEITPVASMVEIVGMVALLVITVFAYEALPEELLFRGYVFRNLTTAMAPWIAAIVQAVLFTLFGALIWVFGSGWDVFAERLLLFAGPAIVFGLIRIESGSVWTSVGMHLGFQVVAQCLLLAGIVTVEGPIQLVAIVPPFVVATALVAAVLRRRANWTRREPDPPMERAAVQPGSIAPLA